MQDQVNDELVDALASEIKLLFEDLDPTDCIAAILVITSFLIQKYSPNNDHAAVTNGFCSLLRQTLDLEPIPPRAFN